MAKFTPTNSHQLSIVVLPIVMVVLATVCVALRFRARRLQKSSLMLDDWLCLAALILTWVFQAVNIAAVLVGGAGLPLQVAMSIDPNVLETYLQIVVVNFTLWVVVVSAVQLSIVFFYIRLFGVVDSFRWICYAFVGLIAAFGIAGFFSEVFSCTPVSKAWRPMEPGSCVDAKPYCSAIGLIHVIFDFGIVALPIPLIWKLQIATRSKIVLCVLLCLGLIASIISLLKIVCLIDLTGIPQEDVTDYLWLTILLQTLELPIGIICCCVPSLRPVLAEIVPKFNSMTGRLLSYTRGSRSTGKLGVSDNESVTGFAKLGDSSSHVGQRGYGNKASAQTEELELASRKPNDDGIAVISSYSISRH